MTKVNSSCDAESNSAYHYSDIFSIFLYVLLTCFCWILLDVSLLVQLFLPCTQRYSAPENINNCKEGTCLDKDCCTVLGNGTSVYNTDRRRNSIEDVAATRIQTAYRAYLVWFIQVNIAIWIYHWFQFSPPPSSI